MVLKANSSAEAEVVEDYRIPGKKNQWNLK